MRATAGTCRRWRQRLASTTGPHERCAADMGRSQSLLRDDPTEVTPELAESFQQEPRVLREALVR